MKGFLMIKGFRQIASLTALSRVFGLVRDISFGYFLGAGGLMDAWVIAFRIPNLARRLFGEGAASASFIPVYSEQLHKDPDKASRLANTVVTLVFMVLAAIVVLGWTGMGVYRLCCGGNEETRLILSLTSITLPYMVMVCVVAILAGVLNVHCHFASPAAAPIVLNIFIISSLILAGKVFNVPGRVMVFWVAVGVLIAGIVQILMQIYPLRRRSIKVSFSLDTHSEGLRKILLLMGPMIIGLTVTQINTLADDIIAWCLSGSEQKGEFFTAFGRQISYPLWRGSVSHLYFSQRLYQFPLGVLGISLATAIFPVMSSFAASADYKGLAGSINKGLKVVILLALPATIGLILVRRPLVSALLEHGEFTGSDTVRTGWTLCFYAIGLNAFFAQQILTRAFYSLQESKIPMKTACIAVGANLGLNLTLIWFMGTAGLALSTTISSYLQVGMLSKKISNRFSGTLWEDTGIIALKSAVGTVVMGVLVGLVLWTLAGLEKTTKFDIIRLCLAVPAGAGGYWIILKLLRVDLAGFFKTK